MSRILGILNAYDHRNRGDRAIIEAQMAWLSRKVPDAEFRVFSPAWKENAEVFGNEVSLQPPIGMTPSAGKIANVITPLGKSLTAAFQRSSHRSAGQGFNECDAYFLCGGGYLYSSTAPVLSRQLWTHAGNAMLAMGTGRPVMQFPQSWGPVEKPADRWICHRLAERLPIICSRGQASTRLLQNWGYGAKTIEVPDIVISLGSLRPDLVRSWQGGDGTMGIAPIDFGFAKKRNDADLELYLKRVEAVAHGYIKAGGRGITLFPQVQVTGIDEDLPIAAELERRLKKSGINVKLLVDCSWHQYFEEIAAVSVFLGSRMHSCIFALISNVPTIGLSYQPKFEALFAQLGMSERCFPITDFDPSEVATHVERLVADPAATAFVKKSVGELSAKVLEGLNYCWERSGCQKFEAK
jgi:colanic acid/amylovoran biosynthesis protein